MSGNKHIYQEVNPNPNFSKVETMVLEYWRQEEIFQKSIDQFSADSSEFIFYDGPPFADRKSVV